MQGTHTGELVMSKLRCKKKLYLYESPSSQPSAPFSGTGKSTLGTTQGTEKGTTCLAGGLESRSLGHVTTIAFLPLSPTPLMFWSSTRYQTQVSQCEDAHPEKRALLPLLFSQLPSIRASSTLLCFRAGPTPWG